VPKIKELLQGTSCHCCGSVVDEGEVGPPTAAGRLRQVDGDNDAQGMGDRKAMEFSPPLSAPYGRDDEATPHRVPNQPRIAAGDSGHFSQGNASPPRFGSSSYSVLSPLFLSPIPIIPFLAGFGASFR